LPHAPGGVHSSNSAERLCLQGNNECLGQNGQPVKCTEGEKEIPGQSPGRQACAQAERTAANKRVPHRAADV
jgi:hypothetical protein